MLVTGANCSRIGDTDTHIEEKRKCKPIRKVLSLEQKWRPTHSCRDTSQTPHSCVVDAAQVQTLNKDLKSTQ